MNQIPLIDYLELRFKVHIQKADRNNIIKLNTDCYIHVTGKQSKLFASLNNLYINSTLVGSLAYHPKTPVLPENYVSIKFENEHLYSNKWFDFYLYIVQKLGWSYDEIKRIDIASDLIGCKVFNFINRFYNNKATNIIFNSHADITPNAQSLRNPNPLTYHIGSTRSNKSIKVYIKTKELLNSKKQYIKEFWKLNGLDYENNEIERFELTLINEKAKEINLFMLTDINYLNNILKTETKGFFQFTRKGKKGKKDVTPIQFDCVEITNTLKYVSSKKAKKQINKPAQLTRTIKTLYKESLNTNIDHIYKESLYNSISSIIDKHPYILDTVNTKLHWWEKEFKKENNIINN